MSKDKYEYDDMRKAKNGVAQITDMKEPALPTKNGYVQMQFRRNRVVNGCVSTVKESGE